MSSEKDFKVFLKESKNPFIKLSAFSAFSLVVLKPYNVVALQAQFQGKASLRPTRIEKCAHFLGLRDRTS